MTKYPWFPFYPGDWLTDPNLSKCRPATRGIWMDAICAMDKSSRSGKLTGTIEQLSRICRCFPADICDAIADLKANDAADILIHNSEKNNENVTPHHAFVTLDSRDCHAVVTLINRRMKKEASIRDKNNLRQRRKRGKEDVTPLSHSPSRNGHGVEVISHISEYPPSPPFNQKTQPQKRAPADFVITPAMREWAVREVPGVDIEYQTARFKDCEFKNAHQDWEATWRNWMRKEYEDLKKEQGSEGESLYPEYRREDFE